jgi:DNA repair protein RadC
MKPPRREPGAETGAESAEVRKARNGAGSGAVVECGRSAEKVRNLSPTSVPSPAEAPPALPAAGPTPSLVRTLPAKRRELAPARPPTTRGDGWPDDAPPSLARGLPAPEQAVIDAALAILARRVREPGAALHSPGAARELVRLHLAQCERERFAVLFLDAQHAVMAFEVLFEGTLTQTSVYPRELVRRALQLNAAAVILAHNHPSGTAEPSRADEYLTATLRTALALVDVRVLDHLVIGWPGVSSMAELGLMEPEPAAPPRAPGKRRGIVQPLPIHPTTERSLHV